MSRFVIPPQIEAQEFRDGLRASGLIYYVTTMQPGFPVKIGLSNEASLAGRLRQLQIALPYKLAAIHIHAGTVADEAALHERFDSGHLRGEWFEWTPDLRQHFHKLRKTDPDWRDRYPGIPKGVALTLHAT